MWAGWNVSVSMSCTLSTPLYSHSEFKITVNQEISFKIFFVFVISVCTENIIVKLCFQLVFKFPELQYWLAMWKIWLAIKDYMMHFPLQLATILTTMSYYRFLHYIL